MKVLKKGNAGDPVKPWSAKVGCRGCGAQLLLEEGDLTTTLEHLHVHGEEANIERHQFTCCECGLVQALKGRVVRDLNQFRQAKAIRAEVLDETL